MSAVHVSFYPEIMKLGLRAEIRLESDDPLQELKQKAFEIFWESFPQVYQEAYKRPFEIGRHGGIEHVIVKDLKKCEIKTGEIPSKVQVWFSHPVFS